jgi:hypothetical protein
MRAGGFMLKSAAAAVMVAIAVPVPAAQYFVVPPELWDRPRSARAVLEQPVIRQAVNAHLAQPAMNLVIHHAAGLESTLQAEELRAWLVALAVSPERVRLSNSLKSGETLQIELMP